MSDLLEQARRLSEALAADSATMATMCGTIRALVARVEAAERDAERYRQALEQIASARDQDYGTPDAAALSGTPVEPESLALAALQHRSKQ